MVLDVEAVVEAVEAMDKRSDTMWESFEAQREREREREREKKEQDGNENREKAILKNFNGPFGLRGREGE